MIDIPVGKTLVPVEVMGGGWIKCRDCFLISEECRLFNCFGNSHPAADRQDGKNVIFKLVDWPREEKQ
jgi:hypothetical protein